MLKKICVILILLNIVSCSSQKYTIKSEKELSLVNWQTNVVDYIPLMQEYIEKSNVLKEAYYLLNKKKYHKLTSFLEKLDANSTDYYLIKALMFVLQSEFSFARTLLQKIAEEKYGELVLLLKMDMFYELSQKYDYNINLNNYQKVLDKYPDNNVLREIVKQRIRKIRYNH